MTVVCQLCKKPLGWVYGNSYVICDTCVELPRLREEVTRLGVENYHLREQNTQLRNMVHLLRWRIESELRWMQNTIDGIH